MFLPENLGWSSGYHGRKESSKKWFRGSKASIICPPYVTTLISVKRIITNISDQLKAGSSLVIMQIIFYFVQDI